MNRLSLGFVGGGRVTRILLEGLRRAGAELSEVLVVDPLPEAPQLLAQSLPELSIRQGEMDEVLQTSVTFLAIHPPAYQTVLPALRPYVRPEAVVVSLAPKVTVATLARALNGVDRIIRMIPNAPSIINQGYNPFCFAPEYPEREREPMRAFFALLGRAPEVLESKLEAYAVIAAIGPTYLWFQFQELRRLAIEFGLSDAEATQAVSAMADGALQTLFASGLSPDSVMDLIPVRPLGSCEEGIRDMYRKALVPLYARLK